MWTVYEITCEGNGLRYFGCTNSFVNRRHHHISSLRNGKHVNAMLLDDYRRFGENAFAFRIVSSHESLAEAQDHEKRVIREYAPTGMIYNVAIAVTVPRPQARTTSTDFSECVNIKDAATVLGITRQSLHRKLRIGNAPACFDFGGRTLFRLEDLETWKAGLKRRRRAGPL